MSFPNVNSPDTLDGTHEWQTSPVDLHQKLISRLPLPLWLIPDRKRYGCNPNLSTAHEIHDVHTPTIVKNAATRMSARIVRASDWQPLGGSPETGLPGGGKRFPERPLRRGPYTRKDECGSRKTVHVKSGGQRKE